MMGPLQAGNPRQRLTPPHRSGGRVTMTATHQGRRSLVIKQERRDKNWKRLQVEGGHARSVEKAKCGKGCVAVEKAGRVNALKLGCRLW